jgi:polar amino acid transport system substrate-binding protein
MKDPTQSVKRVMDQNATLSWVYLLSLCILLVASTPTDAAEGDNPKLPIFRHVNSLAKLPANVATRSIRLLAEHEFPPFSYEAPGGKTAGVSVDLALAACIELKITCSVVVKPFDQLVPALLNGEGDIIVSGLKIDEAVLKKTAMTRPYFWSLGRFAVPLGSQLRSSDIRSLAGKRVGFVDNTSHGAWLAKYYGRSTLTPFPTEAEMLGALRGGSLDAAFGDDLRMIFWLGGSASRGCCKTLDGAYVDRQFFSRNLAFLARRDDREIVQALDYALDRLQENGKSSEIFARYLPNGFW